MWVAQKKWREEVRLAGISYAGKDIREAHNAVMGTPCACGVVVSINAGKEWTGTSRGGNRAGKGIEAYYKKDMGPRNDRSPGQAIDWGPVLETVQGSPGGFHSYWNQEGGCNDPCASWGLECFRS